MSLATAVPFGVAASCVYGASIVVQHRSAHCGDQKIDTRHLVTLFRNPLWLLAIVGDFVGFLLQLTALTLGPVVFIQPLVVLMLPVALLFAWVLGAPRPSKGDLLGCAAVVGGLGLFLGLIGHPGATQLPHNRSIGVAVLCVLVGGVLICLAVRGRRPVLRGAVFGIAAGAFYGTVAVLVDALSERMSERGVIGAFAGHRGIGLLICIIVLGVGGTILTQMSFQIGKLGATLPANTATDPAIAVLLGMVLLHERFPLSPAYVVAYVACLAAVVAGAIRLANPSGHELGDVPCPDAAAADAVPEHQAGLPERAGLR